MYIASIFLPLKTRNNFLRLNILKVFQLTEKHLQKIISMDEFIRRIYSVIHSNDSSARGVTLRYIMHPFHPNFGAAYAVKPV